MEIQLEIASAIEWYQYQNFPWTEASTVPFDTVKGQRYYTLPANFLRVTDALSQIGNYTYKLIAVTEQYIDRIDWGALTTDPPIIVGFSDGSALLVTAVRPPRPA